MTAGPLWAFFSYVLGVVVLSLLLGFLHRRIDRYRHLFRTAAPDLFSEDGSPKIPERYDRTRN